MSLEGLGLGGKKLPKPLLFFTMRSWIFLVALLALCFLGEALGGRGNPF
jgi:hypothetical protein